MHFGPLRVPKSIWGLLGPPLFSSSASTLPAQEWASAVLFPYFNIIRQSFYDVKCIKSAQTCRSACRLNAVVFSRGAVSVYAPTNHRPHFTSCQNNPLSKTITSAFQLFFNCLNEMPRLNFYDLTITENCVQNMGNPLKNHKIPP